MRGEKGKFMKDYGIELKLKTKYLDLQEEWKSICKLNSVVYAIRFNGKIVYIGTANFASRRIREHLTNLIFYPEKFGLLKEDLIQKKMFISFEILEHDVKNLRERELYWIKKHKPLFQFKNKPVTNDNCITNDFFELRNILRNGEVMKVN